MEPGNLVHLEYVQTIAGNGRRGVPFADRSFLAGLLVEPGGDRHIYSKNCLSCHGPERKGGGNYPGLVGIQKKYSLQQLYDLIGAGRRMMPAFKQLSADERAALASFILENRSQQQKELVLPSVPADTFRNLPAPCFATPSVYSAGGIPGALSLRRKDD